MHVGIIIDKFMETPTQESKNLIKFNLEDSNDNFKTTKLLFIKSATVIRQ